MRIYKRMEKKATKLLVEKVISSLNWDAILEVNKYFKSGSGEGSIGIPGIKRKSFSGDLTKADFKSELRAILKHVISNDLAEFFYGSWIIIWNNGDWGPDLEDLDSGDAKVGLSIDSSLEVIYSPQRIFVTSGLKEELQIEESDINRLENMLKEALGSEKYELASKIRDIINLQKETPDEDK